MLPYPLIPDFTVRHNVTTGTASALFALQVGDSNHLKTQ